MSMRTSMRMSVIEDGLWLIRRGILISLVEKPMEASNSQRLTSRHWPGHKGEEGVGSASHQGPSIEINSKLGGRQAEALEDPEMI